MSHTKLLWLSTGHEERTSVLAIFRNAMRGATHTTIDLASCFPFSRARIAVSGGFERLKYTFSSFGFWAGSDNALIIKIFGNLQRKLRRCILGNGILESELTAKVQSRSLWYVIVDGEHTWRAVLDLICENPNEWERFKWPVFLCTSSFDISVLRQLARSNNYGRSEGSYIKTTLFDKLCEMKQEYQRLQSMRGDRRPPTSVEVAFAYNGWKASVRRCEKKNSLAQMA